MAKFQPKGGNLLEIRGLAGTSIDEAIHNGIVEAVAAHPEFKIVSTVTGDWDQTTAQKAVATVLPSLPDIVGVVDQGGDGYGAAQALAAAGRPRPTIIMPHYGVERAVQLDFRGVYRVEEDGSGLTLLAGDFGQPNGLCFSRDEKRLFVNDTERGHIRAFDVGADGLLAGGAVWAEVTGSGNGAPDGMAIAAPSTNPDAATISTAG